MPTVLLIGRFVLGGIFLFSGYQKLAIPIENFQEILRIYEVFPELSITFLSYFVPLIELAMGVCLIMGLLTRLALTSSTFFFSTFIFVLARGMLLKLPLEDCGCFGEFLKISPPITLGLDICFLILSVVLLFSKSLPFRLDSLIFKPKI